MADRPATPPSRSNLLALPSPDILRQIEAKQNARAAELRERRKLARSAASNDSTTSMQRGNAERTKAAELIQRNYRGHRTRRAMEGRGLDASTRWIEALKEAKYANATAPVSRDVHASRSPPNGQARSRWKRVGAIAQRAGSDDTSDTEDSSDETREKRRKEKRERERYAKIMGLDYFLEMVDVKHRYGSNLRRYHVEWKKSETKENFFYWLDEGEGKTLDLEDRPRKRLDSEFVRYLSREERTKYLIRIDGEGRFVFDKNGDLVTTSMEFRDSIDGIVSIESKTPTWREVMTGEKEAPRPDTDDDSISDLSSIGTGKHEDQSKYSNEELHDAKGIKKLGHLSSVNVMNHLLRKTTKTNTWIFVADTSFRLYLGIKQSGAFQHSSFLHGARVAAAGLIKIKRGQLRKLSPLSGHYAPPVKNFREFVRALKEAGADMSRCSISRSYAVLLGLEGYQGAKKHVKLAEQSVKDLINPEEKRKREEAEKDKSQSAETERRVLEQKRLEDSRTRSFSLRVKKGLGLVDGAGEGEEGSKEMQQVDEGAAQR
ncbi:hypothetical protein B0A48_18100 [Cryoendolithus antarcticus]|uniref:IQ domain-containing protein IQM6 n=1 Tax=Cryoendolithus antarcticus TaxID=1507870 RepID=A0A1V8S9G6_9PEZI|nr:hypothetical protein B0A48_18100 [Cryoendolithus antarcticus]